MLENDITDVLELTFAEETDYFGRKSTVELRPGGKDIKVTNDNKREYVNLVARHRMTTAIRAQVGFVQDGREGALGCASAQRGWQPGPSPAALPPRETHRLPSPCPPTNQPTLLEPCRSTPSSRASGRSCPRS